MKVAVYHDIYIYIYIHVLLGDSNVMYKYKVLCYIPNAKEIVLSKTLLYICLMFFFLLLVLIFSHTRTVAVHIKGLGARGPFAQTKWKKNGL